MPAQICNKCSAKLHISFQFKKQCERADSKLRLLLLARSEEKEQPEEHNSSQVQEIRPQDVSQSEKLGNITHQLNTAVNAVQVQPNDCVFIECNPILDQLSHEQNNFISVHQQHQTINYSMPHHNQLQIGGYALQNVYNSTYNMQLQPMQCSQSIQQMQVSLFIS